MYTSSRTALLSEPCSPPVASVKNGWVAQSARIAPRSAIGGRWTRRRALMRVGRVSLWSVHARDAHGDPGDRDQLGPSERRLAPVVVRRDVPPVGRHGPDVEPRRGGAVHLHAGQLAGPRVGEVERIGGDEIQGPGVPLEAG